MSTSPIAAQTNLALPSTTLPARRHNAHGASETSRIPSIGKAGELPVATGSALMAGAVQSLQQSVSSRIDGAPARVGGNLNVTA